MTGPQPRLAERNLCIAIMYQTGMDMPEIARSLDLGYQVVRAAVHGQDVTLRKGRRGPAARPPSDREAKMVTMYRQGVTLEKIGQTFDLTRERVRQLIKRQGVSARDGGCSVTSALKGNHHTRRRDRLDAKYKAKHGMTFGEYKAEPVELRDAFRSQQNSAVSRGISFSLTFAQWLAVWRASGKIEMRGRGLGRYCMSRILDTGGYEVGNVHIQLVSDNSKEAVKKWLGKVKENRGVFFLYPGRANPYLAKYKNVRLGYFATETEAVAARNEAIAQDTLRSSTTESSLSFRTPKSRTQQRAIFLSDGEQCK